MEQTTLNIPAMALRGLTIFPNMLMSLDVEREASIRALERAMENDEEIFLVAQREIGTFLPSEEDLYAIGTVSAIRQILRISERAIRVLMEGKSRAVLKRLWQTTPYLRAHVELLPERKPRISRDKLEALLRQTFSNVQEYCELSPRGGDEILGVAADSRDPGYLADYIAQNLMLRHQDKQLILEELRPTARLEKMNELLKREMDIINLEQELERKLRQHMGEVQREHILREQLQVIRRELGESDEDNEIEEYRQKILALRLEREAEEKLLKELGRLSKQSYSSAEASVLRSYLDICLEVPWNHTTKERVNVAAARKALDQDHFGLEKVKERILEFIAVRQINPAAKGQIICLAGPPGVGKTSIAISVAAALNRKLARLSLGGVRDEADIRGHRRTYIGAMPGRIVNAITQSGSMNPLLLLDEIDKMGGDFRGDPASALLEVLDSEQNHAFRDHFLEIPLDLSRVLFITTANTTSTIPRPLLDRMEVIELTSYTDEEKLQIARRYLLPKQMKEHGVARSALRVTDEALRAVITGYTRESGVRSLERQMGKLCRKTAMRLVSGESKRVCVAPENLEDFLGVRRYLPPVLEQDPVGVVNGLAWTESGGELLEVEVNAMEGTGKLELTGNLGDVMKESAHAALSCIRSRCAQLGIDPEFYKNRDIHIHFPEGAVPKDGPSAGVAITTAVVSALTGRKVRGDVAMTGEVTLRGRVLAIGGLKEKTMAAKRSGIRTVLIPKENRRDLAEIDPVVRESLRFVAAETIDEVLAEALRPAPKEEKQIITAFVPVEQPVQDASLRQ